MEPEPDFWTVDGWPVYGSMVVVPVTVFERYRVAYELAEDEKRRDERG